MADKKIEEKTTELKDHKQIGQEMELFFTNEIAPGLPFWLPRGWTIFRQLEKYIRELTEKNGYQETSTPMLVKTEIFKQSGHWMKFGEHNMYNLSLWEDEDTEEVKQIVESVIQNNTELRNKIVNTAIPTIVSIQYHGFNLEVPIINGMETKDGLVYSISLPVNYSLKPMSCPESTVLYRFRPRSYKELPIKFSELGRIFRREKSGEVNGLVRVRQITQDDAHIYCTEDQILNEIKNILDMMIEFYDKFGFEYDFRLATRPELFAGTQENWKKAEGDLVSALKSKGLDYTIKDKDGAFYGPKIDVHIKDSLGREWQLATVQLDFHQPEAFNLSYINNEGAEVRPVMIHRAIFGSFERFIAILTEQFQGSFPVWLAPIQVAILPISEKVIDYAKEVEKKFIDNNIRVELDLSNQSLGAKIRTHTLQRVPFLCIIGDKEVEASSDSQQFIAVRTREGKDLGRLELGSFLSELQKTIEKRI